MDKILLVLFVGLLAASCGGAKSTSAPTGTPVIHDSLTAEQRVKYCLAASEVDSSTDAQNFAQELKGYWTHKPSGDEPANYNRIEFRFDPDARVAALSTYYDWGHDVVDISLKKFCLSKPLDTSHGGYAGYRLLEFEASNNDGVGAVLVKRDGAKLLLSDYFYDINGAKKLIELNQFLTEADAKFKVVSVYYKN